MFIDIHGHCLRCRDLGFMSKDGQPFVWAELLQEMHKEVGIDRGVLLPLIGPDNMMCVQSNEEVLDYAQASNGHFIPFCNIDPRWMFNSPDAKLDYVMEYYKDKGCKGIGEMTANLSFTDPRCLNLFRCAEKVGGLPITFHIATRYGNTYGVIDDMGLPRLETVLKMFPNLQFLAHSQAFWSHMSADVTLDNWGGYPKGKVTPGRVTELMRKYPNLNGDLSAGSGCNALTRDPQYAYEFLDEFQDRLFFGTDACRECNRNNVLVLLKNFLVESLDSGHISQEIFDKVTHKNAIRLLNL